MQFFLHTILFPFNPLLYLSWVPYNQKKWVGWSKLSQQSEVTPQAISPNIICEAVYTNDRSLACSRCWINYACRLPTPVSHLAFIPEEFKQLHHSKVRNKDCRAIGYFCLSFLFRFPKRFFAETVLATPVVPASSEGKSCLGVPRKPHTPPKKS